MKSLGQPVSQTRPATEDKPSKSTRNTYQVKLKWSAARGLVCPICDEATIETAWQLQQMKVRIDGASRLIQTRLPARRCTSCGTAYTDAEAEVVREDVAKIAGQRLVPQQIRAVREFLGLTQLEMARLTGFGKATWVRWENGQLVQSSSSDRMLRILWTEPGRILARQVLREVEGIPDDAGPSDGDDSGEDPFAIDVLVANPSRERVLGSSKRPNPRIPADLTSRFPGLNVRSIETDARGFSLRGIRPMDN